MVERFRRADAADAEVLWQLERATNLVALADIFPAEEFGYPDEAVLTRWRSVLADPAAEVWLCEVESRPVGFVAFDADLVRHLAVLPEHWRSGHGAAALDLAVSAITARGAVPGLWCLRRNRRALEFYRRRGWRETGEHRECPYPPHPTEVRLRLEPAPAPHSAEASRR